jgi:hypothetical protein
VVSATIPGAWATSPWRGRCAPRGARKRLRVWIVLSVAFFVSRGYFEFQHTGFPFLRQPFFFFLPDMELIAILFYA